LCPTKRSYLLVARPAIPAIPVFQPQPNDECLPEQMGEQQLGLVFAGNTFGALQAGSAEARGRLPRQRQPFAGSQECQTPDQSPLGPGVDINYEERSNT